MRQPFRLDMAGPPQAYQTYSIVRPLRTHWKRVRCEDAPGGCAAHERGWQTTVDTDTLLGAEQARYINEQSGRHFTLAVNGGMVRFTFPAGQQCFQSHHADIGAEPLWRLRDGDWRTPARPGAVTVFKRADDWRDHFATHQDYIATHQARG